MQSTRFLAANMLRQQPMLRKRMLPLQPARTLRLQATPKLQKPVPGEDQAGHGVSQRLRKLKRIPPELIPLGIVLAAALGAAAYSMGHTFVRDKTLRLTRQGPQAPADKTPGPGGHH